MLVVGMPRIVATTATITATTTRTKWDMRQLVAVIRQSGTDKAYFVGIRCVSFIATGKANILQGFYYATQLLYQSWQHVAQLG